MAQKHRYEFQCGHRANASNAFALDCTVTIHNGDTKLAVLEGRFCPRCVERMERAYLRCMESGKRSQRMLPQPLPEVKGSK